VVPPLPLEQPAQQPLYDGVPAHLRQPMEDWLASYVHGGELSRITARLQVDGAVLKRAAQQRRATGLYTTPYVRPWEILYEVVQCQPAGLLYLVHLVLMEGTSRHAVVEIMRILENGRSAWKVAPNQRALVARQQPPRPAPVPAPARAQSPTPVPARAARQATREAAGHSIAAPPDGGERVHEVARECGVSSKVALEKLAELGNRVTSASSVLEAPVARRLREALAMGRLPEASAAAHGTAAGPARDAPSVAAVAGPPGSPPGDDLARIVYLWDKLRALAPDRNRAIEHLAAATTVPRADIERLRTVRNRCSHPVDRGWPGAYELASALLTAQELHRQLLEDGTALPTVSR
jgi:hypothetical protein